MAMPSFYDEMRELPPFPLIPVVLVIAGTMGLSWCSSQGQREEKPAETLSAKQTHETLSPEQIHETLYELAYRSISHLDGESGTLHGDWSIAYTEGLGRPYDVHTSNPRENLSNRDLARIIIEYEQSRRNPDYSPQDANHLGFFGIH